jgi:hypothetical protein
MPSDRDPNSHIPRRKIVTRRVIKAHDASTPKVTKFRLERKE